MTSRSTATALLLAFFAAIVLSAAGDPSSFSSATYVTTTSSTATIRASSDWTPPSVSMGAPGGSVSGTTSLTASAADAESGIASVTIQSQSLGADGWTTVCTDPSAPYSCSWTTTLVADGQYDLRAVAVDGSGFTATSDQVRTVVANNIVVVLASPGEVVRGDVVLNTTIHGGGTLSWSVTVEYAAAGTAQWRTACASSSVVDNQAVCTWRTVINSIATGYYDVRAIARTTNGASYTSSVVTDVLLDNTLPTAAMTDPGTPLRGTVTLVATATEGESESGIAQVVLQYAPMTTGSYQTACTLTAAPYSCRFDTTKLADGSYSVRAVATDAAGNTATTAAVTNRVVDNTVSAVSVEDPGAYLTGTVPINVSASSSAGVTSVRIQAAPGGTSTWTDICTDASAPYSCAWNTTTVADGLYDLRALLTDGNGVATTSAVVSGRRIDNAPLRGVDVQTANGTGTVGRVTDGDTLTFTYSRTIAPGTVATGWTGSALNVTARLRDGNIVGVGTGSKGDTLDVRIGTTTLNLGSVNLKEDYIKAGKTVTFNGTITETTLTVNGVDRTVVTLRLGTRASGTNSSLRTVNLASAAVWSPSGSATTLDGVPCSMAPVTETGPADREF